MKSIIKRPSTNLPDNFQFSQASLQAYVDCPRLFQLHYIQRVAWPAPKIEPAQEVEHYMNLGSAFHQMVQQYLLGVPKHLLSNLAKQDPILINWWDNFLSDGPQLQGYTQHPEVSLSIPLGEFRLVAKYDLIAIPNPFHPLNSDSQRTQTENMDSSNSVIIFDWKTSRDRPRRKWQAKKLQTRVYPLVFFKAGAQYIQGSAIHPDQIKMVYWFSNFPTSPVEFQYTQEQLSEDETYITGLINEIKDSSGNEAPKTENGKRCRFCSYRSLCNRGTAAGKFDEFDNDIDDPNEWDDNRDLDIGFEQIAEIEF